MSEISTVIPCLNEENSIEQCIAKVKQSYNDLNIDGEIIVVDNGSSDNTAKIAGATGVKALYCKERGYGNALRCGFRNASGKYIFMADGDNSYNFAEIPKFYKTITKTHADMLTGSRLKGVIEKGAMPLLHRYIGTPFLTFLFNILFNEHISDINCGMRMFKKSCLDKIEFKTTGMEFASELFVQFKKNKFLIMEIPINLYKTTCRKSKLNPFRDGFRHLVYLMSAWHK